MQPGDQERQEKADKVGDKVGAIGSKGIFLNCSPGSRKYVSLLPNHEMTLLLNNLAG